MIRFILAIFAATLGLILIIPVLAGGLVFMIVASLVHTIAGWLEPPVLRWQQIYEFDAELGWKAKAHLDCHLLEDRDDIFHVVTDEHGWPGTMTIERSEVVVFGDSHAWGYGVDHKKAFSQLDPSVPLKAVAAPGYNLVQELLLLEQLAYQLKGKLVVWFVYIGNDLFDNLSPEMSGYRTPFVRQVNAEGKWEVVTRHLSPERWRASDASKLRKYYPILPALYSDTFLARRAYAACRVLIEKGAEVCRGVGADLVVMAIPSPLALNPVLMQQACKEKSFSSSIDVELPDRELAEICREQAVRFISLKQHMTPQHFKPFDDHWTEEGHRNVAHILGTLHREWKHRH
ncbi:MAG: hypothetical protein JNL29_09615 [Nitrospira sp.]|nr:hypothetical protein [Nitrospira sp.]